MDPKSGVGHIFHEFSVRTLPDFHCDVPRELNMLLKGRALSHISAMSPWKPSFQIPILQEEIIIEKLSHPTGINKKKEIQFRGL